MGQLNWLYRNKHNHNKFVEVRRQADGHYYFKQYVKTFFDGKNYTGCTLKQNRRGGVWQRTTLSWMKEVVFEDYELVEV